MTTAIHSRIGPAKRRPGRDERRLAGRLQRRDGDALRDVYERFGQITFGFLVNALRDRATAEDVQQQVYLEVWQRAGNYDADRGTLLTWIMTIARSRAIDELRRRVPEPRNAGGTIAVLDSAQGLGDDRVDALVEQWHLAALIARLPASEAELLRRRFYGGQTQSEIADETGIPLGTVKARMRSGLDGLRRMFDRE